MIRSKIASRFKRAKKTLFLCALVALALHVWPGAVGPAHAQGSRKDDIVFNSRGTPLAGATVRVCTMPASGQPCTPLALVYSDAALTQALANPTTTDGLGNYFFYAAPGKYEIEISGPGITTKQIPNVILPNDPASPTFSGGISAFSLNLSGNLTVNGNTTVVGNLASGTLSMTNQATPPGTAGAGTVNVYTKTADKRLYYKDDTGAEIGPIAAASGAQTNAVNTFTANQNFDSGMHVKGPDPYYDVTRFGSYQGSYPTAPTTTGSITSGQTTLTTPSAFDVANGQYVTVYGAGPTATIYTPGAAVPVSSISVASNVATVNVSEWAAGFGQSVIIAGSTDTTFNGTFTTNTGNANAFSFTINVTHANCNPCTIGSGTTVAAATPFITSVQGILNGSTTWQYKIVAEDMFGGLSAASAPITISTGASTLGANSVTIAANGCSRTAAGLTTITTTAAHNFQAGVPVLIVAGSTGDQSFEGQAIINTTPTSTTFTFFQYGAAVKTSSCSLGGTAKVVAKNIIRWNQRFASIIGHWIYRCSGTGCTNYTLIGHSDGVDGAFIDYGLAGGLPNAPGYVPQGTPPASPANEWLSAKVNSGGGTTTLTLSAAASSTVSGATVLHDNTPVVLAICAAMGGSSGVGGTIYWPDTFGAVYPATTNLDMRPACPQSVKILQAGRISALAPLIPKKQIDWEGAPQGAGGLPLSFAAEYQAQILGNAYPLIYQAGSDAVNSTFENLSLQVARSYQGGYYQDGTWSEGTNVTFRNVSAACSTPNGCFPMRPGGQFFYLYDTVFFSNGAANAQWGVPEPFIQTISFGIGNGGTGSPQSLVSDIEFRYAVFSGGGVLFDSKGQQLGTGANSIKCVHCLLENSIAPLFRFNLPSINSGGSGLDLEYASFADSAGGGAMPLVDFANVVNNSTFSGIRIFGASCANGGAPLFAMGADLTRVTSVSTSQTGPCGGGAPQAVNPDVGGFGNQQVSVNNASNGIAYLMQAVPNAPTVAISGASGPPAGTYFYNFLAYDVNGNGTLESLPSAAITVNGSQGVQLNWTLLPGQVATTICRGTNNGTNLCATPSDFQVYKLPGTSFLDNGVAGFHFTASAPLASFAASSSMTGSGIQTPQLQLTNSGFVDTLAGTAVGQLQLTNSGFVDTLAGTWTASRTQTLPDNTGIVPVTSYLNSAYDNATRANGAIGSNWTIQQNGLNIASNQIQGTTGGGSNTAFWNVNAFSPVQFAQATIAALNGATDFPGVTALASGTGSSSTYYDCVENSTTIFLQRVVNGGTTNLTSTASTGAVGDILRLEVGPGGALTCFKNGASTLTAP